MSYVLFPQKKKKLVFRTVSNRRVDVPNQKKKINVKITGLSIEDKIGQTIQKNRCLIHT